MGAPGPRLSCLIKGTVREQSHSNVHGRVEDLHRRTRLCSQNPVDFYTKSCRILHNRNFYNRCCVGIEHGQLGASHSALALRPVIDTQNPAEGEIAENKSPRHVMVFVDPERGENSLFRSGLTSPPNCEF